MIVFSFKANDHLPIISMAVFINVTLHGKCPCQKGKPYATQRSYGTITAFLKSTPRKNAGSRYAYSKKEYQGYMCTNLKFYWSSEMEFKGKIQNTIEVMNNS